MKRLSTYAGDSNAEGARNFGPYRRLGNRVPQHRKRARPRGENRVLARFSYPQPEIVHVRKQI
jgi:hypothetical protein